MSQTKSDEEWQAIERLWRLAKRDMFAVVEESDIDAKNRHTRRLLGRWGELCSRDIDLAASLAHQLETVVGLLQAHGGEGGPDAHFTRQLQEVVGMAELGRERFPDTDARTVEDLVRLGEEAARQDVEEELG